MDDINKNPCQYSQKTIHRVINAVKSNKGSNYERIALILNMQPNTARSVLSYLAQQKMIIAKLQKFRDYKYKMNAYYPLEDAARLGIKL